MRPPLTHTLPRVVRKESSEGIGCAVAELNDVRHLFCSTRPARQGTGLCEQAEDALKTIDAVMHNQGTRGSIVHQAVFIKDLSQVDVPPDHGEFYGPDMPATSYIPQPPCEGKELAIEAMGLSAATCRSSAIARSW